MGGLGPGRMDHLKSDIPGTVSFRTDAGPRADRKGPSSHLYHVNGMLHPYL